MSTTNLIICDCIDREVMSISEFLNNSVILDTNSLSSLFLNNAIYIGIHEHNEINFNSLLPTPSSVGSVYWRSINPLPFLSSINGPRNGIASVNLILSQYRSARWFNSPKSFWSHINKPLQLEQIRGIGIEIPETLYTSSQEIAKIFINKISKAIIKPISGGDYARLVDINTCEDILDVVFDKNRDKCVPFTIQKFIDGINIRSYVIGGNVYSAKIISDLADYRTDPESSTTPIDTCLTLRSLCLKVQACLNLEWTAIDWIKSGENFIFLEANFSPMFYNFQNSTGYPISKYLAAEMSIQFQ